MNYCCQSLERYTPLAEMKRVDSENAPRMTLDSELNSIHTKSTLKEVCNLHNLIC